MFCTDQPGFGSAALASGVLMVVGSVAAAAGVNTIGVNRGGCQFDNVAAAIAAAGNGATIYIEAGTYNGLLGQIPRDMTLVPARPNSSCREEDTTANSATVIIDGGGGSFDPTGGLVEITDGAVVTFRHMWLRNATATNGGVIAVTDDARLILDDALATDGTASGSGGVIYALGTGDRAGGIELVNDSSVYRGTATVGDGGAIALFGSNLIITDGNIGVSSNNGFSTAANNGGGIFASQSSVSLNSSQSRVIWNEAGNFGGGIYADTGTTVTVNGALFNNNDADVSGGAIYFDGTSLQVTGGAQFVGNTTVTLTTNQGGGALYLGDGDVVVDGALFTDNQSATLGGAILGRTQDSLDIRNDSSFTNNSAVLGGGLYLSAAAMVSDSAFVMNDGGIFGGGIRCSPCTGLTLSNVLLDQNMADDGGGLSVANGSLIVITGGSFTGNQALDASFDDGVGGAIHQVNGSLTIDGTQFQGNTAQPSGGAIYVQSGNATPAELTVTNAQFTGNQTTESATNQGGGGIFAEDMDAVYITNSIFDTNSAATLGGGLLADRSDVVQVQNSQFVGNSAILGGGLYSVFNDVALTGSDFSGNNVTNFGGGLYVFSGSLLSEQTRLAGNDGGNGGGGVYLSFTDAQLVNSQVEMNTAVNGAGIYVAESNLNVSSNLSNCDPFALAADEYCSSIDDNVATDRGGGVFVLSDNSINDEVRLQEVALRGNDAALAGTAIHVDSLGPFEMENVLIADNGDLAVDSTTVEAVGVTPITIESTTIAGNADSPLWVEDTQANVTVNNSILYLNGEGPRVAFGVTFARSCNNAQSVAAPSQSMGGNLGNPIFDASSPRGNYRLTAISPSVDACLSGPATDGDGAARPNDGGQFDQGAFELDGAPSTAFEMLFSDGFETP